jgi:hypothetical protein
MRRLFLAQINLACSTRLEIKLPLTVSANHFEHEVIGGVPTSTVLGKTLFEPSTSYITSFTEFIKFPTAISQVSGEQYSIVVNYLDAPPLGEFLGQWIGSPNNEYLGGQNFFSNDLTTWEVSIGDLAFRTFVLPSELSCR